MTNKEITTLLYRFLSAITSDGAGNTVRFSEIFEQTEVIQAIKTISGKEVTLENFLSQNGEISKSDLKEIIEDLSNDLSSEPEISEIKEYLIREQNFPEELLTDENLNWLLNRFKQIKMAANKSKAQKPQEVKKPVQSESIKDFIRNLYKFTQSQKCGNAVNIETFFPDDLMNKVSNEVFGKPVDLFDIYTEKEIKEDLLWGYEDAPEEETIKDYLTEDMEVSEILLTKEVLKKLVDII